MESASAEDERNHYLFTIASSRLVSGIVCLAPDHPFSKIAWYNRYTIQPLFSFLTVSKSRNIKKAEKNWDGTADTTILRGLKWNRNSRHSTGQSKRFSSYRE